MTHPRPPHQAPLPQLLLLLSLALALPALAGAAEPLIPDMSFRRLDTRDGLSHAEVNCVFQDSQGFVWLGTHYGLNRFDGYRIRTYYSSPTDTLTLADNVVDAIQEDHEGRLWLRQGTRYSLYDPRRERFDRHPEALLARHGVEGGVERVFIDRQKRLWVKTYEGPLHCLDLQTGAHTTFTPGQTPGYIGADESITHFTDSRQGVVATTRHGTLLLLDGASGTVSWRDDHVRHARHDATAGYYTYCDPQDNLWVITSSTDTHIRLAATGEWLASVPELLRRHGLEGVPPQMLVWDVRADRQGRLWVATDHQGLYVADLKTRQLRQFLSDRGRETSLSESTLKHLYLSPGGQMWICSYKNGVNLYVESLANISTLDVGDVNTITEDLDGRYWLGTNDAGIRVLDTRHGTQQTYNQQNAPFRSNVMVASLTARDGSLYFGTYEGGLMRHRQGHWTTWLPDGRPNGLQSSNVWGVADDADGNIWVGTLGGGVQRLDQQADTFATLNQQNSPLGSNYILSMNRTPDGWILAGTSDYYALVNPKTDTVINGRIPQAPDAPAASPSTSQVVQDSRGIIWQASAAGVSVYDPRTGRVALLDRHTGLAEQNVVAVAEDKRGALWVVTDHAVHNVVMQWQDDGQWQFAVRAYNNRDGLQTGPYNQRAIYCARDGSILVGGQGGLDIIDPASLGSPRQDEHPLFSGLRLGNDEVAVGQRHGGRVVLGESLNTLQTLRLRHSDSHITLELASDAGIIGQHSRFIYRLEGLSDRWTKTDPVDPNVTLLSLPSGSYTLCVKMLNDDGTVGDVERRLQIVVAAPWYWSWWALLAYALLVATALRYAWWLLGKREQKRLLLERIQQEADKRQEMKALRRELFDKLTEGLKQPFGDTFQQLDTLMRSETDEQRYQQEQQVYQNVETLMSEVQQAVERVSQQRTTVMPALRDVEIESLDQKLIRQATKYVEDNLDNADISVETMAQELGMSRVHLYKRLLAATGTTPSEFMRQLRLRHAERLLRLSQLSVSEVAYKVGFNSPRYFSKYFSEMYGETPSQYKQAHSEATE